MDYCLRRNVSSSKTKPCQFSSFTSLCTRLQKTETFVLRCVAYIIVHWLLAHLSHSHSQINHMSSAASHTVRSHCSSVTDWAQECLYPAFSHCANHSNDQPNIHPINVEPLSRQTVKCCIPIINVERHAYSWSPSENFQRK